MVVLPKRTSDGSLCGKELGSKREREFEKKEKEDIKAERIQKKYQDNFFSFY